LAGVNGAGAGIVDSEAGGTVYAADENNIGDGSEVGGLVGYNAGLISNSFASAASSVTSVDGSYAGGLVGWNIITATIINSYAAGSVFVAQHLRGLKLLGRTRRGENDNSISDSYASAAVTALNRQHRRGRFWSA